MARFVQLVILLAFCTYTLADYTTSGPTPAPTITPQIFIDSENVDVPAEVTRFCHHRCRGACEACCHFDYNNNFNYDELCYHLHGSKKEVCEELLLVIDFICTMSTYKYSVIGTTMPIAQERVFPNLNESSSTASSISSLDDEQDEDDQQDEDDHSSHGRNNRDNYSSHRDHKDHHSYRDTDHDSYSKRAVQQTTNYGNLLSGSISKTCLTCPRKKRGYGNEHDDNDDHPRKQEPVPDHDVFVCGNPFAATEWVPTTVEPLSQSVRDDESYYY